MNNKPLEIWRIPKFIECIPQSKILYKKCPYTVKMKLMNKVERNQFHNSVNKHSYFRHNTKSNNINYYFTNSTMLYDFVNAHALHISSVSGPLNEDHSAIQILNQNEDTMSVDYEFAKCLFYKKYDTRLKLQPWFLFYVKDNNTFKYNSVLDYRYEICAMMKNMFGDSVDFKVKDYYGDAIYTDEESAKDILLYLRLKHPSLIYNEGKAITKRVVY